MDGTMRAWSWAVTVPLLTALCLFGPEFTDNRRETNVPSRPLTEAELEQAVAALRTSGEIEKRLGDADWSVDPSAFTRYVFGVPDAVAVRVVVEPPVDASGTWRILRCRGTRVFEGESMWRGAGRLGVTLDLASGRVVSIGVAPGRGSGPQTDNYVADFVEGSGRRGDSFDLPSGDYPVRIGGRCPNGLEDD